MQSPLQEHSDPVPPRSGGWLVHLPPGSGIAGVAEGPHLWAPLQPMFGVVHRATRGQRVYPADLHAWSSSESSPKAFSPVCPACLEGTDVLAAGHGAHGEQSPAWLPLQSAELLAFAAD